MIQFACPNPKCARRYNADPKHADQRFKCPACQTVLRRVAPAETPVRPPPVINRHVAEDATAPAPPPLADQAHDRIDYVCTHCHVKHRAPTSAAGTTVRCPDCGRLTVVAALLVATESSTKPPPQQKAGSDESLRRQQLGILAGQIRRVILIEETIDQAERKLRELDQAGGNNNRRLPKP